MGTGPATYDASVGESFLEFILIFTPFLIAYTICIIQAGRLAVKRGRDRPFWTGMSVIFGPFALLVLALLPKREYYEDSERRRRRRRRRSSSSSSSSSRR